MAAGLTPDVDLLVVGAGIHGVGVARAAATAGLSVAVIERTAPAAGTSSRSSKLIHGGLRYLETAQFGLVRESLRERRYMRTTMPDYAHLLPMHIPVYRRMQRSSWQIRAGLSLYALLAGLESDARFESLPRSTWPGLDGLDITQLSAVFRYHEVQTDDAALTRAILAEAVAMGAQVFMPAELVAAECTDDGVCAMVSMEGGERELRARVLVNAAGPWAPLVDGRISPGMAIPAVELVQGTHVEYEGALSQGAFYVEAPADGRAVFVLPWRGRTLVGTTETLYRGDPAKVVPLPDERTYLHDTFAHHFPARAGQTQVDAWAGLRVLPANNTAASRRSRETLLHAGHPRLLSIYGGKLTTWRSTAAKVIQQLAPALGRG